MKFVIVFFVIFLSFKLWGKERPMAEFKYTNSYSSDLIMLNTFEANWRNHRRDHLWSYKEEETATTDFGARIKYFEGHGFGHDFKALRPTALVGRKFSKAHYLEFEMGVHSLENHISIVPWKISYQNSHNFFHGSTSLEEDLMFQNLMFPGGLSADLKGKVLRTRQVLTPHLQIRVPVSAKFIDLNDGNQAKEFTADALWGKAYPVWFWIGLGVVDLRYDKQSDLYWTPEHFTGMGTRFEVSYGVWDLINLSWTLNYNRSQEDENAWGDSYLNSFSASYGDRNEWQVKGSWTRIKSMQDASSWQQDDLSVFFNKSF